MNCQKCLTGIPRYNNALSGIWSSVRCWSGLVVWTLVPGIFCSGSPGIKTDGIPRLAQDFFVGNLDHSRTQLLLPGKLQVVAGDWFPSIQLAEHYRRKVTLIISVLLWTAFGPSICLTVPCAAFTQVTSNYIWSFYKQKEKRINIMHSTFCVFRFAVLNIVSIHFYTLSVDFVL